MNCVKMHLTASKHALEVQIISDVHVGQGIFWLWTRNLVKVINSLAKQICSSYPKLMMQILMNVFSHMTTVMKMLHAIILKEAFHVHVIQDTMAMASFVLVSKATVLIIIIIVIYLYTEAS